MMAAVAAARTLAPVGDMVRVPGGVFRMGDERYYPEEAPVRPATVDAF